MQNPLCLSKPAGRSRIFVWGRPAGSEHREGGGCTPARKWHWSPPKIGCNRTTHFPFQNHQKCFSFSTLKTILQETPLAQSNLQPFLQAKFVKIMRAEICKINQHLSKVLYFTVLLHILQCAQVTYIMLTHHMKVLLTYSNFHLKITRKCAENQHRKSDQHFLPPRPVLRPI